MEYGNQKVGHMKRVNEMVPRGGRTTKWASGLAVLGLAAGGVTVAAPSAFALSTAPTHGRSTCASAGDECRLAIAYANAHDGGGATVLAVEADTENYHGSTHRVFDIKIATTDGVVVVHALRNDNAPVSDGLWQTRSDAPTPSTGSSTPPTAVTGNSSGDSSPDTGASPVGVTDAGPSSTTPSSNGTAQLTATQAASDATAFATSRGYVVRGVKKEELSSHGPKEYYQVKLSLGATATPQGTMNVWVDATSTTGAVSAASADGTEYRDTTVVSPGVAQTNALAAISGAANGGGAVVYKTSDLQGGKWRWYWVFVRSAGAKYKVAVDAYSGVVTQVRQN